VADEKVFGTPLGIGRLNDIWDNQDTKDKCAVPEKQFPCSEICLSKVNSITGAVYTRICPCCSIWESLPDSTKLTVTYIFECDLFGYCKRIKE
jgi:hypothetical protein